MHIFQQLPRPFFVLAPMDDVTDTVFRRIVVAAGKPDLFVTEFTNVDGFCSAGRQRVARKLAFTKLEQPLIAQVWGLNPDNYVTTAKAIKELGFVGIDINMGCPQKKVVKRGACAALIKNHELAGRIITAVQAAVGPDFPVSVKTRIGYNQIETEDWIIFLLGHKLAALTVHCRTAAELSKVPAHHEELSTVVRLRDQISPETVIIANGDITTREQGRGIVEQYGVDGVMIGRGIFHNPYVFVKPAKTGTKAELLALLRAHLDLHEQTWGSKTKTYQPLKRFFKIYVNGFDGAAELRDQLMRTNNHEEARALLYNVVE